MNVLYLEDEPSDAQLVKRYFNVTPHNLILAATVEEAQSALTEKPDLILVDVRIGQVHQGFDFVRDLRAHGHTQPIVAVTALSLPQEIEQCYRVGCNAILNKPFVITQLADLVTKYTR